MASGSPSNLDLDRPPLPTGGNDSLTITSEVAVSDRLGAERRKSSAETRMYGLTCGLACAVATSPHLEHQGGLFSLGRAAGQTQGYVTACGCGDG
jgi:hypothetical protein